MKNFRKLETLYGISRPIVLVYMVGDAIGMITMPFLIVMVSYYLFVINCNYSEIINRSFSPKLIYY